MTDVMINASSDTVGDFGSYLGDPGLCFRPLAQACPLTLPSRLSFRNMSNSRASYFSLSVISPNLRSIKVLFVWICSNSLETAFSPFSLNLFRPILGTPVSLHDA